MPEIDALSVKITSSAKSASNGINSLVSTLEKLKKATAGATGLENTTKGLSELSLALKILDSSTASRLKELAEGMSALKAVSGIKLSPSLPKAIGEIITAAKGLTIEDTVNLKMLAPAIASLSAANDVKISSTIGSSLSTIVTAMKGIEPAGINNLRNFANAAGALSSLNGIKISSSIGNQLASIGAAVELLNSTPLNLDIVQNIADAVAPLANVGKANMTPAINQLKKIPEVARELEKVDVARFKQTVQEIANAMAPLAQELDKIGRAFSNFPNQLNRVATLTNNLTSVNTKAKRSFTEFLSAAKTLIGSLKAVGNVIIGLIKNVNTYIEDVNLFQASMGEYADAAGRYADKVAEVMGIDPATWMRNQGVFMTLATGFGVAGDRAYIMSQQLTQLGYDLSSFFNLDVDDAMQKLQSGLSGELEPLRRLGYDLSQARLQAIAFSLGIDKAYSSMTQAEKSQLRYYAIMTQVTTAQGDMARTLEAPANQIRIFSAQVTQAARALGSALIPMLNKILPYAIAAAKAIRILAASIASLFGFELPEVDYSGITGTTGAVDDLTNSLDGAGGSAKKLKSYLMGFDELNVIDPNSGSGGGGGGGIGGITGDDFDFDLPQYDFLGDAIDTKVQEIMTTIQPYIDTVIDNMDLILTAAKAIGGAVLLWKVADAFVPGLSNAYGILKDIQSIIGILMTAGITIGLSYQFTNEYLNTGKVYSFIADALTSAFGTAITGAMVAKMTGKSALGSAASGAVMAISAGIDLLAVYNKVKDGGITREALVADVWAVIQAAIAGGLISVAIGGSAAMGVAVGGVIGVIAGIGITIAAARVYEEKLREEMIWGGKSMSPEEIRLAVEGLFDFDVAARIEIMKGVIANRQQAQSDLERAITDMEMTIGYLNIRPWIDATPDDLNKLANQAADVIAQVQNLLISNEEVVQVAVSFVPGEATEDGTTTGANLVDALGIANTTAMEAFEFAGETLGTMIAEGVENGLDKNQAMAIANLSTWMIEIANAAKEGMLKAQFEAEARILLNNADGRSWDEVMADYSALIEEYSGYAKDLGIEAAGAIGGSIAMLEATIADYEKEMYEGGPTLAELNPEIYAKMQADLEDLQAKYEEWQPDSFYEKMTGDLTGAGSEIIIEILQERFGDTFADAVSEFIDDPKVYRGIVTKRRTHAKSYGMPVDDIDFDTVLQETLRYYMEQAFGEENYRRLASSASAMGVSTWDIIPADLQQQWYEALKSVYVDTAELMTSEEFERMFIEAGYMVPGAIATGMTTGANEFTDEFWQQVDAGLEQDPYDIPETMADVVEDASAAATETVEHMTGGPGDAYMERMSNSITEGGADAVAAAEGVTKAIAKALFGAVEGTDTKGGSGSAYKGITNEWSGIAGWFEAAVTDPIAASFGNMRSDMEGTFRNVKSMFQSQWSGISGWFASNVARPMVNSLKNAGWYDAGREAAQGIKRGLDSVELPKFHLDWNTVTKKVEETTINLPILDLKFYARGGFPTAGQMFVARESGPELVGRIGNRSAVANNDQIVAGIEEGVYRAVTAAVSDSDNNINVTVYLDGKQLYRNQQQVARATGYSFAK